MLDLSQVYDVQRGSCGKMFSKIDALKNFAFFTGNCMSLFLRKSQACNFINKRLQRRCFPVNIP